MTRTKYKCKFDEIMFRNRWSKPYWNRTDDWTIIGIHKRWFSHDEYEYRICFFGFELHLWFKRFPI